MSAAASPGGGAVRLHKGTVSSVIFSDLQPHSNEADMPNPIELTHVKQTKENWCWAACSEMIVKHFGGTQTQSDFAEMHNEKLGYGDDHMAGANEVCWLLKNRAGRQADYFIYAGLKPSPKLTWEQVCQSIDNGHPLIVSMVNHALVVAGYGTSQGGLKYLVVHDPSKDSGTLQVDWSKFVPQWVSTVQVTG